MATLQQIHYKKNEIFEVEFFKDKECTEAFDFTNAKNLYIQLVNGDCTPIFCFNPFIGENIKNTHTIFISYIPILDYINEFLGYLFNHYGINIFTINDIAPNLSKYIPEDNAVLFLSEEDLIENRDKTYPREHCYMQGDVLQYMTVGSHACKKFTIFLPHGTQSERQKANEVEKELRVKYGVEEVNLFALHWFIDDRYTSIFDTHRIGKRQTLESIFNKIITTNSIGILKPEDISERLQVIDCKEIFEEYLKTER